MDVQRVTHGIRLRQWTIIVKECQGSGKTIKRWCEEQGVSSKSYYYWQRKIREAACQELSAYHEQVQIAAPTIAGRVFAELKIPEEKKAAGAVVTIRLNNATVEIHNGAEAAVIESALRVLKSIC